MPTVFDRAPVIGMWYPRLVWNGNTLDLRVPVTRLRLARKPIRGQNIAESGAQETLYVRTEQTVSLAWQYLPADQITAARAYVDGWGLLGEQAALTLDRYLTCQDQEEYAYNATFTKAELVNDPFEAPRAVLSRAIYSLELVFRQGV